MSQARIASHYLHWLHDYVRAQGHEPTAVLGVLPEKATQPFQSMQKWREQLEAAAELLGDTDLGLHFGLTITPARFGALGYLLHHCETLGHAFLRMQQYQRLLFELQNSHLEITAHGHRLSWDLGVGTSYQLEAFTLASIFQFARTLTGKNIGPHHVSLCCAAPASSALQEFLGGEVEFSQQQCALIADPAMLALPNIRPDAALCAVLEEQANTLLATLPASDELTRELRRHIVSLLPQGEPTQERAAALMNTSSRTLHRRLAERGLRFRDVLEKIRHELAENYLRDAGLSLAEVALLLGYAEQSPFTHAFKRWSGITPLEFRKQHCPR